MFCPKCRSEFRPGITRCANCDKDLVAELPGEDAFSSAERMADMLTDRELEAIVVGNYVNLREVQKELAKHRIPSVIAGEAPEEEVQTAVHNRLFLMVAEDELDKARSTLEARWKQGLEKEGLMFAKPSDQAGDTCPACGAAVPAKAESCPECELFLGAAEE